MYLKRLELQGFKSFADKTVLEFMPGITTVIGPNGSGKSNISDSIRWVLGEQSMKSLRGSKSEDIIFAGTQNRKSLGFAEVSLVFDNSDGKLPIEYAEVTVTRKIYRSGETGYYINKVPCRLKDVSELFMDTGIGKDGYSIIGQGKIDEILSNKSEDRRHIFEEAAGIVKYRVRKGESEKKLEQTKLNLLRIHDILSEVEANMDPLKQQSEKAKRFLDLREELKGIEVGLFLSNIHSYKEKLEQIKQDEKILMDQNAQVEEKKNALTNLKETLKQETEEITAKIEELQNAGMEEEKQKERMNSDIHVATEKINNNKENKGRYEKEIQELTGRIIELEEERKQKLEKKDSLSLHKQKYEQELKEKEEELGKLTQKLSGKELEIEEKKMQVEKHIDSRYELTTKVSGYNIQKENLEKRVNTLKQELQISISELDGHRITKDEMGKTFYDIEAKRNEIAQSLEDITSKKQEVAEELKKKDAAISGLQYDIRMKDARLKFLVETEKEKEGYGKSVKALLQVCERNTELGKGIHGVLASLLSVPKEYETAIEMALGNSLQNIVTEKEEDAKRLIEYLRKQELGRASFLPISTVRGKKVDKIIQNSLEGIIGIASDLIQYDKKYEQIVWNLLGRTVVVKDMDTAILLAKQNNYSFKIITLKGDTINPSGSITGGSVSKRTVNILGRGREIQSLKEELEKLNVQLDKSIKEKQEYEESIEDTLEEATGLEKILQDTDIIYATEKQKMVAIEENIEKAEHQVAKIKEETEHLAKQKEEIQKEEEEANHGIVELSKQIEEWNKQIEEFALLNKDDQKYIDDLNADITNLKISVSSFDESNMSIDEIVERIKQEVENHQMNMQNKEKQLEQMEEENKQLQKAIEEKTRQMENLQEETKTKGNKVQELKQTRTQKSEELTKTESQIEEQFNIIEGLKEQLIKIDVKKTKTEQDLEEVISRMWEEYELTPNNAEGYAMPENIQNTQKKVNELRNQIRDLGSINIDSIEEYRQVKERYDYMCEQRLDLESSATNLRKVIQEMTNQMKEQFKEKFEIINKNFDEVFRELFGGGKAELVLEDENNILECGIDIRVQPTGKKLQNMMLLSGGEKAFTAIALLFAILRINPAPFCVLDEIEAALDDVNVYRFAEYLKKFSNHTQFLVITHRKGTMEAADTVYGITMEENGISKLLSMKMSK